MNTTSPSAAVQTQSIQILNQQGIMKALEDKIYQDKYLRDSWLLTVRETPDFADLRPLWSDAVELSHSILEVLCRPIFLKALSSLVIPDPAYEIFLTHIRKAMLLQKVDHPDLLSAMAEQCRRNAYVFYVSEEEKEALVSASEALIACYDGKPLKAVWDGRVLAIDDQVSKAVREQYEQAPYPLWDNLKPFEMVGFEKLNILVAGCGTGQQLMTILQQYPYAQVTAIDLSVASLNFAQQKVSEFGAKDRVEFIHGDILSLGLLEQAFDAIVCTGVLHHMKEPERGFQILSDCLKSGGIMQLGLYSETARYAINACRKLVKERGLTSSVDDIRRFRREVIGKPGLYQEVMRSADFFTLNECRDLLFHVQEHQFNIPKIEKLIEGHEFCGFTDQTLVQVYVKEFPGEPQTLENWDFFEKKHPLAFSSMYVFKVRKP